MENSKKKITSLKKKDSKALFKFPNNKRLTEIQNSKKIPINLSSFSHNKHLLMGDLDNISTRQTSDSLINNKKNNTNINFVYKKKINKSKISYKDIKNQKVNSIIKTDNNRKTMVHSTSAGY